MNVGHCGGDRPYMLYVDVSTNHFRCCSLFLTVGTLNIDILLTVRTKSREQIRGSSCDSNAISSEY